MVTPNEQEAQAIGDLVFPLQVTTLGAQGCCINGDIRIPACKVPVVDTTGAGDTFNGALAVCLAEGMSLPDACRYASAASGLSVTKPGVLDAIPYRNEVERLMCNG